MIQLDLFAYKPPLTQERLKELLRYCPESGVFTWRVWRGGKAKAGSVAGNIRPDGYLQIGMAGKLHLAHRLAFLYMEGHFPPADVDHIDCDRLNNRWSNLRHATRAQNMHNSRPQHNNTSGTIGVTWHKANRKWVARIAVNDERIYLGIFETFEEATEARNAAEAKYFGEFRHQSSA